MLFYDHFIDFMISSFLPYYIFFTVIFCLYSSALILNNSLLNSVFISVFVLVFCWKCNCICCRWPTAVSHLKVAIVFLQKIQRKQITFCNTSLPGIAVHMFMFVFKDIFTDLLRQKLVTFPGINIVCHSPQKPDSSNANSVKFVFGQNMSDRVLVRH